MKRTALSLVVTAGLAGAVASTALPSGRAGEEVGQQAAREAGPTPSAREVRGPTPYLPIENEPPPRLIVDPPIPKLLERGVVLIQYRTENCRILPVFGEAALDVSPRVGHLHIRVDDLPWLWADASDLNTVDMSGMPPGDHEVTIDLVDANHQVYPGQSRTVKFTVPSGSDAALQPHR